MNELFLTRKNLADRYGCTPQHISNLVREEKLPVPIPISDRISIWKREDIENLRLKSKNKM